MQRNLHLTCVRKEGRIRKEGFYRTRFFFSLLLLISRSGGLRSSNVRQTLILMLFYYNNNQQAGIRFNEFSYSNHFRVLLVTQLSSASASSAGSQAASF